jgi:hypothetical protein
MAVCMSFAVRCVIIICCKSLLYLQLRSCMLSAVHCVIIYFCNPYFIYSYVAVCMLSAVHCVTNILLQSLTLFTVCSCMYVLCSTLCYDYLLQILILFRFIWLYICTLLYVVLLLFVANTYFIYSSVALGMCCAECCFIIICCNPLFYLQLCSCMCVLCSSLCYDYLLQSVTLFTAM